MQSSHRNRLLLVALFLILAVPTYGSPEFFKQVTATADNSYMIGYGPATGPSSLEPAVQNSLAADVFTCGPGPELYVSEVAASDSYLYVVAWSDDTNTSGVLLQHYNSGTGQTLLSGATGWEVYATGVPLDTGSPAPSVADVQNQVVIANGANAWVTATAGTGTGRLAVGEMNDVAGTPADCPGAATNVFPIACQTGDTGITSAARWMWYNPNPGTTPKPFCADGTERGEYLIFRIVRSPVGAPVPALSTWGMIALVGLLMAGGAWFLRRRA